MKIDVDDEARMRGGWCFRDFRGNRFEAACIGWAGIEAEHLLNHVDRLRTPLLFPLTETTIAKWHWEALYFLNELSDSDRQHIVGHPDTLETCQHAFRILSRKVREIGMDAKLLADRTRIERGQKLAALREFEELKTAAARWAVNPPKISCAERAMHLENYLRNMPADAPERLKFAPLLDCLRRGEEPNE